MLLPIPQGVIQQHLGHSQSLFLVLLLCLGVGLFCLTLNFLDDVVADSSVLKQLLEVHFVPLLQLLSSPELLLPVGLLAAGSC